MIRSIIINHTLETEADTYAVLVTTSNGDNLMSSGVHGYEAACEEAVRMGSALEQLHVEKVDKMEKSGQKDASVQPERQPERKAAKSEVTGRLGNSKRKQA